MSVCRFEEALSAAQVGSSLERCWEQRPFFNTGVLSAAVPVEFAHDRILAAITETEALLSRTEVISEGRRMSWQNISGQDIATREGIETAFKKGLTILVRRFDLEHQGTASLARAFSKRLRCHVFATLFLSNHLGPAFPAHYDSANVIAVQLHGSKRWNLFSQVNPLPQSDEDVKPIENDPS